MTNGRSNLASDFEQLALVCRDPREDLGLTRALAEWSGAWYGLSAALCSALDPTLERDELILQLELAQGELTVAQEEAPNVLPQSDMTRVIERHGEQVRTFLSCDAREGYVGVSLREVLSSLYSGLPSADDYARTNRDLDDIKERAKRS